MYFNVILKVKKVYNFLCSCSKKFYIKLLGKK